MAEVGKRGRGEQGDRGRTCSGPPQDMQPFKEPIKFTLLEFMELSSTLSVLNESHDHAFYKLEDS